MSAAHIKVARLNPNPFEGWGAYAAHDANRIHWDERGRLVVFHTTTPERAEEILANGPKAHAVSVGFDGESRAPAFWVNCVPWVPYSVEQYHPAFGADQDMAVIACTIDSKAALEWLKIDTSWPFAQWGVPVDAVEDLRIIPADEFWAYRSQDERERVEGFILETLEAGLLPPMGYASELAGVGK